MHLHANAKLGLAGRLALAKAIEEGMTLKAAAAAFSVSLRHSPPLVVALVGGGRGSSSHARLSV